jgi:TolB-like protein/DNA-binding winged helix-turn-helix (wHTH) protein/lipoprotein NlpI
MRLLLYLAAHSGRVVDVQELLDEVWPNVIVTQGSVYQAIAQLRRILGDESEHPKYIENLPRRGYRLIAPVASWDLRRTAATDSNPAAQGLTHVTNGSVAAEPQLTSEAPEAAATAVIPDSTAAPTPRSSLAPVWWSKLAFGAVGAMLAAAIAYLAIENFWISKQLPSHRASDTQKATSNTSVTVEAVGNAFNPPPHSMAVLPFVNISGDQEQEYFSDGLTDELLNSLSRINELQVAARTSSFYFKGKDVDLPTIAHKLNVAWVLEGSVRRSGNKIRITAQFNNAVTGFHLWSQTYDRDLSDVLKLQTEIATAVASALKVTLLGDEGARIELGGTRNPAAFDAYLRATKAYLAHKNREEVQAAIAGYADAIRLDPNYALAYAARSIVLLTIARNFTNRAVVAATDREALGDARRAIALAPDLGLGHAALAGAFAGALDFAPASQEYDRAIALDPGNSWILPYYGHFAVCMGHTDAGLKALRRAVALDPLNGFTHRILGLGLILARRYDEALRALGNARALAPHDPYPLWNMGFAHYALGNYQAACGFCEQTDQRHPITLLFLAITYDKLGRRADAEVILSKFRALRGDAASAAYVWLYAQWGQTNRALDELEGAMRLRDPYLIQLKMSVLTDPLRNEPRFQAIERELKFPSN